MPVITIQALPKDANVDKMLADAVDGVAAALGLPATSVWANFCPMAAVRDASPGGYHPIVTILAKPRPQEMVEKGLRAAAEAVAAGLGVPLERVWVRWTVLEPRHLFADGKTAAS